MILAFTFKLGFKVKYIKIRTKKIDFFDLKCLKWSWIAFG